MNHMVVNIKIGLKLNANVKVLDFPRWSRFVDEKNISSSMFSKSMPYLCCILRRISLYARYEYGIEDTILGERGPLK